MEPRTRSLRLGRVALLALGLAASAARADLVLDGSRGPSGPVPLAVDPKGSFAFLVSEDLGERSGANLFHSFETFTLGRGQFATFTAFGPTDHVIARVTGGAVSEIAGTVRSTIPGASLWLLNPSGVLFTQFARLDVDGSFHASTADALRFEDGVVFPTGDPDTGSLSFAAPSAFGFTNDAPAGIGVHGATLSVPSGRSLELVAGALDVRGFGGTQTLVASGGEIGLLAIAEPAEIPARVAALDAFAEDAPALGSVALTGNARVTAGSLGAAATPNGSIAIRAGAFVASGGALTADHNAAASGAPLAIDLQAQGRVDLGGRAILQAGAFAGGDGGDLRIAADEIALADRAQVATVAIGAGAAGNVDLAAARVRVDGEAQVLSLAQGSGPAGRVGVVADRIDVAGAGQIATVAAAAGRGGDVDVEAETVVVAGGTATTPSRVTTRTTSLVDGAGRGGDLAIRSAVLEIADGGEVSAITSGAGDAGALTIDATDSVLVRGGPVGETGIFARTLRSPTALDPPNQRGAGDGGALVLRTRRLDVEAGGTISGRTFGPGDAGDVRIEAVERVRVDGSEGATDSLVSVRGDLGAGGTLEIESDRVELTNGGALLSTATSAGDGGTVRVRAGSVEIAGVDPQSAFPSGIFAESTPTVDDPAQGIFAGDAGDVDVIGAGTVVIRAGARISARTRGPGAGGDVAIRGGTIVLANGASVSAQSEGTGNAGSLFVESASRVELFGGSTLSTRAEISDGGDVFVAAPSLVRVWDSAITAEVLSGVGSGGNVTIDPDVVALRDGRVTADAFGGPGGNVRIRTSGLFANQGGVATAAGISASSELGVQGTVELEAPETDLAGALASLEESFLDREALLRSPCEARVARAGSFAVRSAGPLPAPPAAPLGSDYASPDLRVAGAVGEPPSDEPVPDVEDVLRALERCPVGARAEP